MAQTIKNAKSLPSIPEIHAINYYTLNVLIMVAQDHFLCVFKD